MIVTEEEAKTKRCQESFGDTHLTSGGYAVPGAGVSDFSGGARIAIQTSPTNCIGSACMAWRWAFDPYAPNRDRPGNGHGYCGKAGRP